jgi:hypothetical protein
MGINIGSAVIPVQEGKKRQITELTELEENSKESIYSLIFCDIKGEVLTKNGQ